MLILKLWSSDSQACVVSIALMPMTPKSIKGKLAIIYYHFTVLGVGMAQPSSSHLESLKGLQSDSDWYQSHPKICSLKCLRPEQLEVSLSCLPLALCENLQPLIPTGKK